MLARAPSRCSRSQAVIVIRGYAKPAGQSNAFRNRSNLDTVKAKKAINKKSRIDTFRSMNPAQLTHPVLQPESTPLTIPNFSPDLVTPEVIGSPVQFPEIRNDPIKFFGTPRNLLLEHRLLSQRASIIRDVTVSTARLLDAASKQSSENYRFVMTGRPGSGKSVLLLQAVRYALAREWVVLYIPRAKQLINSTTPHAYDLRTQTYLQPKFAYETLRRFLAVNEKTISEMYTTEAFVSEKRELPARTPLLALVELGIREAQGTAAEGVLAPLVLERLLEELGKQTKSPVLLAIDDFQCLYTPKSAYRDPHFSAIRPYHLSMPRLLLDYTSGRKLLSNGAVLGAITATDPVYRTPIELRDQLKLGADLSDLCDADPLAGPLEKRNATVKAYAKGLRNLPLPKNFTLQEAAGVFEMWRNTGGVVASTTDELFLSKYTESGGNPREFVKRGLLASLEGAAPNAVVVGTNWPQLSTE